MAMGGLARRPGLVLAVAAWVAFAATGTAVVYQNATAFGSVQTKVYFTSSRFGPDEAFLLVVAAAMLVLERLSSPSGDGSLRIASATLLASAAVTIAIAVAGAEAAVSLSLLHTAAAWVMTLSRLLTTSALAALAAAAARHAFRVGEASGVPA